MRNLKELYEILLEEHLSQCKWLKGHTFLCCVIDEIYTNARSITTQEYGILKNDFEQRIIETFPRLDIADIRFKTNEERTEYLKKIIQELS